MNIYIKNAKLILFVSFVFLTFHTYGQVAMSNSLVANGGGEIIGSHIIVGSFGQPIVGTTGQILKSGFWYSSKIPTGLIENSDNTIPKEYKLEQNFPNPFNPSTIINYQLSSQCFVTLSVYDALGKKIIMLVNREQPAGNYKINFNASSLASGIYFYRISTFDEITRFIKTKKMIVLK